MPCLSCDMNFQSILHTLIPISCRLVNGKGLYRNKNFKGLFLKMHKCEQSSISTLSAHMPLPLRVHQGQHLSSIPISYLFWVMILSGNISHCQGYSGKILRNSDGKPLAPSNDLVQQSLSKTECSNCQVIIGMLSCSPFLCEAEVPLIYP